MPFLLEASPNNYSEAPKAGILYVENNQQERFTALSLNTDIKMQITGLTARVRVSQTFKNNHDQWMEGKYLFPLPDKAAVDHLTMKIGQRLIEGEIKEKQQAKKIYQAAKISGKKASLIEQQRPNLFTNSVANIGPYETIEVIIEYQQDIHYDRDQGFSIRFPMAITPRYQPNSVYRESFQASTAISQNLTKQHSDYNSSGFINQMSQVKMLFPTTDERQQSTNTNIANIQVTLDAGLPIETLLSPSHKISHQQKSESSYEIEFSNHKVYADRDFILNWKAYSSQQPRAAIFAERKFDENYLSIMIMPPSVDTPDSQLINRELIFVIDTSGSMGGDSIRQARNALQFGISTLSENDTFNIIQFNSSTSQLFQRARQASSNNIQMAQSYVNRLKANGGTEMYSAIEASLDGRSDHASLRQVIFLTDGAISNEAQLFESISNRLGDSRLYTVGIGSAPNSFFMKKAARFGRGSFTFISDISQSSIKMTQLFKSISRPQLTHINVQWPEGLQSEIWPNKIPDLYDGEPLWLKAKVTELAGKVQISGRLSDILWQSDLSLTNPKQQGGVAVLWAREKIASIMNSAFHGVIDDKQKQQVIDTAIKHHLVSRFTSLVAVDKTPSRTAEQLHQENIRTRLPKGSKQPQPKVSSLHYANTGLDLDILFRWSGYLLIMSLISLFLFRRLS